MRLRDVTIRDVAKQAGVSVASASRALNNKSDQVSREIRRKVLRACRELEYRPNPGIQDLVRRGRSGHTRSLALALAGQADFTHHIHAASLEGVSRGTSAGDYALSLAHMRGDEQSMYELPAVLRDGRVDGFLLTGRLNENVIGAVKELNLPHVILGLYSPRMLGDSVRVQLDVSATLLKIVEELRKAGRRKIAYLLSDPDIYYAREFFHAYKRALAEHGLRYDEHNVYRAEPRAGAAVEIFREVFARPELPFDAIVSEDGGHAQEIAYLSGMRSGAFGKNDPLIATHRPSKEYRLPIPAVYFDGPAFDQACQGVNLLIDMVSGKSELPGHKLEISTNVYAL